MALTYESIHTWLHVHQEHYPHPIPQNPSPPYTTTHPYPTTTTHPYPITPTLHHPPTPILYHPPTYPTVHRVGVGRGI